MKIWKIPGLIIGSLTPNNTIYYAIYSFRKLKEHQNCLELKI